MPLSIWPLFGWPPVPGNAMIGAVTGLRASDYDASVQFYGTVFGALDLPQTQQDPATWGYLLVIQAETPPTQNADLFVSARSSSDLELVVEQLKSANLLRDLETGENGDERGTVSWVSFLDPDDNRVWIGHSSPVFPPPAS